MSGKRNTYLTMASSCDMASGAGVDVVPDEQIAGHVEGRVSIFLATSLLFFISQDIGPSAKTSNKNKLLQITITLVQRCIALVFLVHYHHYHHGCLASEGCRVAAPLYLGLTACLQRYHNGLARVISELVRLGPKFGGELQWVSAYPVSQTASKQKRESKEKWAKLVTGP